MPNVTAGKAVYNFFYKPAAKKALKANLFILKKYPEKATEDVDILEWTGDLYYRLERYDKALDRHTKQLEVFKKKYFNKQYYPEKEGLTPLQAKTEEYRYIVKVHRVIAACYNATKQYDKGLKEYEKILQMISETKDLDKWDREAIFKDTFITIGKLYKVIFRDYQKAIETYEKMKEELHNDISASTAEIFIGDTYLAMGDVEKAKETYQMVVSKYKPNKLGLFNFAEQRLKNLEEGNTTVATDGVIYEIKDGKVNVRY